MRSNVQKNLKKHTSKASKIFHGEPAKKTKLILLGCLLLAVFVIYFLNGLQFTGPAYLGDEIGHLTKAALFAGYPLDGASSYHGGYSIFLAPVFFFLTDPFLVWKGIVAVNSLLFASSFLVLYHILRKLFPQQNFWTVFAGVVACAVYPSWIVMSGYAFASPAFIFTFVVSVALLLRVDARKPFTSVLFGMSVGFLYWIHLVGIAVVAAAVLAMLLFAISKKKFRTFGTFLITASLMVIVYRFFMHELLNNLMTPVGYAAFDHYGSLGSMFYSKALSITFWERVFVIILGQSAYLLAASLGIIGFGLSHAFGKLRTKKRTFSVDSSESVVLVFLITSLLAVLLMGGILFALYIYREGALRVDHWIYGRYIEMVLLPLLGIGLMALWKRTRALFYAGWVVLVGLILQIISDGSNTANYNNLINTISFWPQYLRADVDFLLWFVVAALGILAAFTLGKKLLLLMLLPLLFLSVNSQNKHHNGILSNHSKPSVGLVRIVRGTDTKCVGFKEYDTSSYEKQRLNMYAFYFYDYRLERTAFDVWQKNTCDFYLSFDKETVRAGEFMVGQETGFMKNLYLYSDSQESITTQEADETDFIPATSQGQQ